MRVETRRTALVSVARFAFQACGEAAWCPAVRLELWRGVTNDAERRTLRRYEALLPDYEISAEVWSRSIHLADRSRASGVTVPLTDLLTLRVQRYTGSMSRTTMHISTR